MASIDFVEEIESPTHSGARDVLFDIDDDGMTCADSLKRNYLEQDFFTAPRSSSSEGLVAPVLSATALSAIDDSPREEQDFLAAVQRIYVVSCLLPVDVVYQDATAQWEVHLNKSQITSRRMPPQIETWWCGMLLPANVRRSDGSQYSEALTNSDKFGIACALRKANCFVIWIADQLLEDFNKYCLQVLWPLMHNVIMPAARNLHASVKTDGIQTKLWEAFERVNQLFASKLSALYRPKELFWVHGYQLMLLPAKLRQQLHPSMSTRIEAHENPGLIYYLHLPFPTSEIFRTLYHRKELLMGILGADLIAFHLYNYLRHFLNVCQRTLYIHSEREANPGLFVVRVKDKFGARTYTRNVGLRVNNVVKVLTMDEYQQIKTSPKVQAMAQAIRDKYKGKQILVGVDRINRMTGISLKLLAFEHLLNTDKSKAQEVVLIQRALSDQNTRKFYHPVSQQSVDETKELLARILKAHGQPGQTLIDFEIKEHMSIEERCALWLAGDVYLHCVVREGLNLKPFEFVHCQPNDNPGGVIISEFSGAAQRFGVEHRINPFHIADVASKVARLVEMDPKMRKIIHERNARKLKQANTHHWTTMVMRDVKNMWHGWKTQNKLRPLDNTPFSSTGSLTDLSENEADYGLMTIFDNSEVKVRQEQRSTQEDIRSCLSIAASTYATSKRRLVLLFDHIRKTEATAQNSMSWILRPTISDKIQALATNPRNQVFVVSSPLCSLQTFKQRFASLPYVGLVMHGGNSYSWPVKDVTKDRVWNEIAEESKDTSWREVALKELKEYAVFINGSKVTSTANQVRLDFSKSDRDWGAHQATSIVKDLRKKLSKEVAIINTPPFLDVRLKNMELQSFVSQKLCSMPETHVRLHSESPPLKPITKDDSRKVPDFILCIGCDADAHEVFDFLDDTTYVDPTTLISKSGSEGPKSSDKLSTLVPLVRRLPDSYVLTLSIHNQRSVEYYCNSLPIGSGRYFSNGLADISMLFRAMMRHSDVSTTGSHFREIVSEQELTSILL